jgi:hypothetical protein
MAAGQLTADVDQTAIGNEMNVLRPETLERLIKLKKIILARSTPGN